MRWEREGWRKREKKEKEKFYFSLKINFKKCHATVIKELTKVTK